MAGTPESAKEAYSATYIMEGAASYEALRESLHKFCITCLMD